MVSGVVTNKFGGFLDCLVLSFCVVSPCLKPTVRPRGSSMVDNLLSISLFNALSGVIYRIESPSQLSLIALEMTGNIAASVFPLPVGATNNLFSPEHKSITASSCIGVKSQPKFLINFLTLGCRISIAAPSMYLTNKFYLENPTILQINII